MLALRDRSKLAPDFLVGFRRFQRSRARRGEVSRAWGEVAAGVRVIVSRARFGGPGLREPCTTDPVSRRVRGASDSGMDPGKSRNMPLQELLAARRPSPRHFSPVSGYPSFVQAPSLLDPLRRESVGSRRLRLEADVGDVPGRVPVSCCDRESRIPGVIPDYPGLSRIKTFDRPHCARSSSEAVDAAPGVRRSEAAGARMVPPGEGNEARGDGRRGVGVSHSTAEAGELSPRDPVEGRGHRQVAPVEGKTANTPRLGPVSTSRHRRRTPRRRAQRARLDPQLRAGAADARPPDRDLPPTQHNLTGGHRRLHRR